MNDIQNKNATKLILNQNRVNQAVMNFEKGNIGVKVCVYFLPSCSVIFPLSALFASILALLNFPLAISKDTSSDFSLSPFLRFSKALWQLNSNKPVGCRGYYQWAIKYTDKPNKSS
jgi:hypothetical protein